MRRPEGISCRQCAHYWWYVGSCNSYGGIIKDTTNNKCNRFVIKTKSEDPWYDPLPTPEQLETACKAFNQKVAISRLLIDYSQESSCPKIKGQTELKE